jgi:activator of HSP90 ATPase
VRSNGPDAMKKYSGDKEVVEAAMEAGDIIAHMQQQASANGSGGSSSSSSSESASTSSSEASSTGGAASSSSTASQLLGIKPEELMQRLMARPDIMARVQNPKVGLMTTACALFC